MDLDHVEINLPTDIYVGIESRAKEKEFENTSDYVVHVLKQVLENLNSNEKPHVQLSKEQEEDVKKGLKELGYL